MHDVKNEAGVHLKLPQTQHEVEQLPGRAVAFIVHRLCCRIVSEQEDFCSNNSPSFYLLLETVNKILQFSKIGRLLARLVAPMPITIPDFSVNFKIGTEAGLGRVSETVEDLDCYCTSDLSTRRSC